MPPVKIDFYTDIACPWCIIGHYRLDKVLAQFPALAVDIEHHPVILMPDCPPQGLRIADLMRQRYNITDPSAAWQRPHAEARASGLALDLSRQPLAFPTLGAHTLIRLARSRGTQHALAWAFSDAYFMQTLNVGDVEVLSGIAADFDFEREEARRLVSDPAELAETQREVAAVSAKGIRSVPHFIINGEIPLNGSPSEDALAAIFTQLSAR
ncbi:MAG: oxidoreductase [Verrucomicrobiaceae bacterium]|nr:oxidoreductase [Verrucomicrobiaceae bacterium]